MDDRPRMYDWSDARDYMDKLEAGVSTLRAALTEACNIALGTELHREALERIIELQRSANSDGQ